MSDYENLYLELVKETIEYGCLGPSRNVATFSAPGAHLYISLEEGFPLLTTRKMFPKGVIGELAAFVRGAEDLATFVKFGCNYWHDNAAAWPPNAGKPEEEWQIGRSYGSLWRNFEGRDQLAEVLQQLRNDPTSRRHVVSAWHPMAKACLPSCHIMFQFHVKGNGLFCSVYMRSADLCVGLPSDVLLYALLTHIVAKEVGLNAAGLAFFIGDAHVYVNHVDLFYEQYQRNRLRLPQLVLADDIKTLDFVPDMISIEDYDPYPAIQYPLNA